MSVQVFPAEMFDLFVDHLGLAIEDPESRTALLACALVNKQFYRRASSHIFSSLSISIIQSQNRLDALHVILIANPDIARCIRSFTVETITCCENIRVVLKQLSLLQKFGWISQNYSQFYWNKPDTPSLMIGNLSALPSLTTFHFENVMHLPLSLFSGFHLKSLSLINVGFAKIEAGTLSSSLFPSLKTLEITGTLWSDEDIEAVKTIMLCAAPTLTTLVLTKTMFMYSKFFLNLNPTVFPVLESIRISCLIYPRSNGTVPPLICQFLDYAAPRVNQIEIEFEWGKYIKTDQPFIFSLDNGWLLLDEILSGPKYPSLKSLHLTFSLRSLVRTEMSLESSSVRKFVEEKLPYVSSCSQIEMEVQVISRS